MTTCVSWPRWCSTGEDSISIASLRARPRSDGITCMIRPEAVGATSNPVEISWTAKDCILYALGVGAGADDPTVELEFTTENSLDRPQQVLPTFAVVPSFPCFAGGDALDKVGDFDLAMAVHAQQVTEVHTPIPTQGTVSTVATIVGIWDKGSGALVEAELVSTDIRTGKTMFINRNWIFIKGEGGWGGERGPSGKAVIPDRPPDYTKRYQTRRDQALLYRLSGDDNPLHSDPKYAQRGGLDAPILHGLCTFGFSGRALLHAFCKSEPDRFTSIGGRFSAPVIPGDELRVDLWDLGDGRAAFQTNNQRGQTVIDAGHFSYTG
ncbi:MaoC/PaaZ C-terminal domain-containing protein [Mycobacterium sp. EPa45]|uniref:MaoC/PaaZ C-terminal domain-containing protein n=1 Tax=Mycobacterium sp. EPa45 TaxID=1545728 RepID=UPI0019108581|nr:MaoC/PaaZ C-terminal domain-containing protein [Mycobacterium sp. EPa45]